jgi:hypothetical protein
MANSEILTLHFLPWCRLEREYSAGPVTLTPFERKNPPATFDAEATHVVSTVLDSFIGVTGNLVDRCTLVGLNGQALIEGYTPPPAFETIFDYVQMACFSSLERREYCGPPEPYSNSECFALITRHFGPGGVGAPPFLRRDGSPTFRASGGLRVHMPIQAATGSQPPFNEPLWRALAELRERLLEDGRSGEWTRWAESIYSFNLANTDSEDGSGHMDWVLMSSAIERLLGARPGAGEVATKVAAALFSETSATSSIKIVREWAHEFYRLRNDYAHGKLRSGQHRSWNAPSHLLLGAIVFPLLVKSLLASDDCYEPTAENRSEPNAFACFAADLRDPRSDLRSWRTYIRDQRAKPH